MKYKDLTDANIHEIKEVYKREMEKGVYFWENTCKAISEMFNIQFITAHFYLSNLIREDKI